MKFTISRLKESPTPLWFLSANEVAFRMAWHLKAIEFPLLTMNYNDPNLETLNFFSYLNET